MAGIVTLSLEVELAWGAHRRADYSYLSSDRVPETNALDRLLQFIDDKSVPLSFDVVGHLFHDACAGAHAGPYPEDWWVEDPGTSREEHPQFYAPDLVDRIRTTETVHEICTHTYSHIPVEELTPDTLDHELELVRSLHDDWGLAEPTSIVLPKHQDPSYDVLEAHGIDTIRCPIPGETPQFRSPIHELYWLLTRSHPMTDLQMNEGILETRCTPYASLSGRLLPQGQRNPNPVAMAIPLTLRQKLHANYLIEAIDRAAATERHVHLWTHLFNISNDAQWPGLKAALSHLATVRDQGAIEVCRMEDLREKAGP